MPCIFNESNKQAEFYHFLKYITAQWVEETCQQYYKEVSKEQRRTSKTARKAEDNGVRENLP